MGDKFEDLLELLPKFLPATLETLYIVAYALIFGGLGGLIIGLTLTVTKPSGLLPNKAIFWILNALLNTIRPIPFIIFIAAVQPLARLVIGTGFGINAAAFALAIAAAFGISRLVEQNLVSVSSGVIEAARAMGAGPVRIIFTVLIPEALTPIFLGYTFAVVAIIDMSAVAGYIAGGGLGDFAIQYGYRVYNPWVTWAAVLIIIVIVQIIQTIGTKVANRFNRA